VHALSVSGCSLFSPLINSSSAIRRETPAAESGQYRFRTRQVHRCPMLAVVEKSPTRERVKSVAMEPAALLRTERTGMCAAQYFCSIRNGAAAVVGAGIPRREIKHNVSSRTLAR